MDTLKYVIKRLLMAVFILFGVSIIIYALARMMPTDYVDQTYSSALAQGTMQQEDVDRIKELYGLNMPDAYLSVTVESGANTSFAGAKFTKNTKEDTYESVQNGVTSLASWYSGSYDWKSYRIYLDTATGEDEDGDSYVYATTYRIYAVSSNGVTTTDDEEDEAENEDDVLITLDETLTLMENGTYEIAADGSITLTSSAGAVYTAQMVYRVASFWDKAGSVLSSYFTWLWNLLQGDLGTSFKYKKPVGTVIMQNMGISFGIAFVATVLQFLIAIPLGIKAATHQYGVTDYTVTVLTMIGISLPTFFLGAIFIKVFAVNLNWFPVGGLGEGFGDVLWHLTMPMIVLVILSVGSLMRYTRTNTLEVLNADYIRTARAKGLSEKTVIYKHAFRNTMIPIVTLMAGILPSLFSGAMITETVFSIPGIGYMAYEALLVADVPFIMGYNMFVAILTVLGTLLSDLMYAVVDPRVKLAK